MKNNVPPPVKKNQTPQRLGILSNDRLNATQSTIKNVPKHSADVFLPEHKIVLEKNKKTK